MNKPHFCRNFYLKDWRHKRLKNTIDLLLFHPENTSMDFRKKVNCLGEIAGYSA